MSLAITDLDFCQEDLPTAAIAGGTYYSVYQPIAIVDAIVATDVNAGITIKKGKYGLVGSADATSAGAAAAAAAAGFGTPSIFLFTSIR